jgi:hypothetical protein
MASERYGGAAKSPGGYPRGPATQTVATGSAELQAERDGDGIPDQVDAAPAPPMEPMREGEKSRAMDARNELGIPKPAPTPGGSGAAASTPVASTTAKDGTLLVYTATLTMGVYQVEPNLAAVERLAKEAGGYLAQRADHQITVRVPRARFDDVLKACEALGDVVHRDVSAEDVTDQYVELETRLRNARAMRDRLVQLLERAPVKEAIEIEKELGRVTGDIESMEGKLKLLRDKVAYSTITVVFEARGGSGVRDMPIRLPFPFLGELGLVKLLNLYEGGSR